MRGTLDVLAEFRVERRVAALPRDLLLELRDERARRLVALAAGSVSWYRDALAGAGLSVADVRGADDLALLPLVERADLQSHPLAFRPEEATPSGSLLLQTTGSTATPLEILHDRRSVLANIAHAERTRAVEASLVGRRYRYRVLDVRARAGTAARVQAYYGAQLFRPLRPSRYSLTVETSPREVVAALERLRPQVFRSYGAFAELVMRTAASSGGLGFPLRAVVYAGDTMSAAGRELIETQLGIPVLSVYNAVECFHIAYTCEARMGLHVHEDLCHVRIVDPRGANVPSGSRGEVVLSNLVNRGTVLLNYRIGDIARLDESPCPCGRTSARLVDLEGRVDEVIELGDGRVVYPTELWRSFRGRPGLLRYQLVQRGQRDFELRVVTDGPAGARAARDAARDLAPLLGDASVEVTPVTDLPAGPGGKFRHIVPLRAARGLDKL